MFETIPHKRPNTPLLDTINSPADLRTLDEKQLSDVAYQLREYLLYCVGQTGGHFGAGLGVVELTVALHYVYNTPDDRLVWDVGHQTYPHKILTGRRDDMLSIRQLGGISGFPKRSESEYDTFGVGHSSTSISAALGMALGSEMAKSDRKHVAIIGDGAMTAGMAFEALHHAAHTDSDLLVILNDNNMSISKNVGGFATYLSKIWASKFYNSMRKGSKRVLEKIPPAWEFARKTEEHIKGFVSPGMLFEEIGFNYVGAIDGHDLPSVVNCLKSLRQVGGPKLLHIITQKGKGFIPAEKDPVGYHALNKLEPAPKVSVAESGAEKTKPKAKKYQDVFGDWLCDAAAVDERLVGITPAMSEGSGMIRFSETFPNRFHDVAIAEQHAVTLAAGIACEKQKPVVAIYSTFLQRGYDQLIHDVAIQNLDVTFGIDRAGIVGEDGPTHSGNYDISFLRCIPNIVIATPSDENECRQLLHTAYEYNGPAAVRYPRGTGTGANIETELSQWPIGKAVLRFEGTGIVFLNFGTLLPIAIEAAKQLGATVWDMRFVKPLDNQLIDKLSETTELFVTLEENTLLGGAGSAVNEYIASAGISTSTLNLGLPDMLIEHGKRTEILDIAGLTPAKIISSIETRMEEIKGKKKAIL
ncbi:MAG: 1-deoxy-D-xylulose-5-phosphate synthase [Cellvibrionaceae bacterium]